MRQIPIFWNADGRSVLVAGGGARAEKKLRLLASSPVRIMAFASVFTPEIEQLARRYPALVLTHRPAEFEDLAGHDLVYGASDELGVDEQISQWAQDRGLPVNVMDRPALSTFTMPAIVDRDPITVAVSSGGASPVLSRLVRRRIESILPSAIGKLADFADAFRGAVKAKFPGFSERRAFWERILEGPVGQMVLDGQETPARETMLRLVNCETEPSQGEVHLVGAGPGDPDLLTLRALRLLQEADVIVYDRLIGDGILSYARRDAELIFVGKAPGAHAKTQAEINEILVQTAKAGHRVIRLKGGDPFIFGRGGEEQAALLAAGIPAYVVPGITAATGCAAASGIPLTHRDVTSAVTFVTGHGKSGGPDVDWAALASGQQTLAIYMGVGSAADCARQLMAHGRAASTPVAVIENGTRKDQRVLTGTLARLGAIVRDENVKGPALLVVGDVVALGAHQIANVIENVAPLQAVAQ